MEAGFCCRFLTLEPEAGYEFINDSAAPKPEAFFFFFFDDVAGPQPEVSVYMINTTGQETTAKVSRKGRRGTQTRLVIKSLRIKGR